MTSGRMLAAAASAVALLVAAVSLWVILRAPLTETGTHTGTSAMANRATAGGSAGDAARSDASAGSDESADIASVVARFWSTLTIADDADRQAEWRAMLAKLTPANAMQVRELFLKMDKQGRWFVPEWDAFWQRWGEVDGDAALEHVQTIGMKGYQPMLAEKILRGWATQNAAGARRWLEMNAESPWCHGALRGYLDGLARTNLDAATQDALKLGEGQDFRGLMEVLTEQALRQRQLGGMVEWWQGLPDDPTPGSARQQAIGHLYWRMQIASATRAGEWLTQLAGTPYRPEPQIEQLAGKLAQSDPAAALQWVVSVPPSPETGSYTGLSQTVQALAARDRTAVEAWLHETPSSSRRDQALVAYARHLDQQKQTDLAEQWRAQVKDPRWLESRDVGALPQSIR